MCARREFDIAIGGWLLQNCPTLDVQFLPWRIAVSRFFAGFDTFSYPGDNIMKSLWHNTNLYWCGFYLGPRFNWSSHFSAIKQMGWGTAPIYTGKQPGSPKLQMIKMQHPRDEAGLKAALYSDGKTDGIEAVQQARAASSPPQTVLYFDVENTIPDDGWLQYYRGWSRALQENFYSIGLYTRAEHASWLTLKLMQTPGFDIILPYIWIAKYTRANQNGAAVPESNFLTDPFPEPDPTSAGGGASSWQHIGNFGMKWVDPTIVHSGQRIRFAPVDFNSSIYRDPGLGILSAVFYGA